MPAVWKSTSQPSSARRIERRSSTSASTPRRRARPAPEPAPVPDRDAHLVAALAPGGAATWAPDEPGRARDADPHRLAPERRQTGASGRNSMARGSLLTDTSPSGARFGPGGLYHRRSPGIVAELQTFWPADGPCGGLAVPALAAVPAAAAPHVPGELVVKYRAGRPRRERGRRARGGRRAARERGRRAHRAGQRQRGDVARRAAALERDRSVVHAVPNYVATATAFTPNDPGKAGPGGWAALQWNFTGPFGINVAGAWDNAIAAGNAGGGGVTVAVLDTGVAYRTSPDRRYLLAPDLDRSRFVRGYDFVRDNKLPYDRNGHGTFVAGVIAQSTNNGIGLTGVAYHSRIMPVRVLDYEGKGDVATIARGIRLRRPARRARDQHELRVRHRAHLVGDPRRAVGRALRAPQGRRDGRRRRQHRGHARRLPRPRAASDRRRRDDRARLRRRLLQLRLRARPGRAGRRRGRVHRHRRQLQAARGPGPRRLPVHVPRREPAQVRPAERLRGHLDGRSARDRHDRAAARRAARSASALRPRRSRSGSSRPRATSARRATTSCTAGAC